MASAPPQKILWCTVLTISTWAWALPWSVLDKLNDVPLEWTDLPFLKRYCLDIVSLSVAGFCIDFTISMLGFWLLWICAGPLLYATAFLSSVHQYYCSWIMLSSCCHSFPLALTIILSSLSNRHLSFDEEFTFWA